MHLNSPVAIAPQVTLQKLLKKAEENDFDVTDLIAEHTLEPETVTDEGEKVIGRTWKILKATPIAFKVLKSRALAQVDFNDAGSLSVAPTPECWVMNEEDKVKVHDKKNLRMIPRWKLEKEATLHFL